MQLPLQSVVPEQVFVMPQALAEEVRVQGWPLESDGGLQEPVQLPLQSVVPVQVAVWPQELAPEVRVQGWPLGSDGAGPEQEPSHWMVPPAWPQAFRLQAAPKLGSQVGGGLHTTLCSFSQNS
ncbi:MAG: hypothetical protein KGJ13_06585 [Patescibacteria group bacterium]|nr:hypothetical protein [Patescibacteria group bacterium]